MKNSTPPWPGLGASPPAAPTKSIPEEKYKEKLIVLPDEGPWNVEFLLVFASVPTDVFLLIFDFHLAK